MSACGKRVGHPELPPGMTRKEYTEQVERKVQRLREAEWSNTEIGAELGIHPDSVSRIVKRMARRAAGGAA